MRDYLFLVHADEQYESFFPANYADQIQHFIQVRNLELVAFASGTTHQSIVPMVSRTYEWTWGYHKGYFPPEQDEDQWIIDTDNDHEYTWVPPVLRNLDNWPGKIYLAGGMNGLCLRDMECVLNCVGLPYWLVDHLIWE